MTLTPYPATLNFEAVRNVAGYFRGKTDLFLAAHSAWDLAGYVMGMAMPNFAAVGQPAPPEEDLPSGEEAALVVEQLLTPFRNQGISGMPPTALSWGVIFLLLLRILKGLWPLAPPLPPGPIPTPEV